jgi:hypothetical protein
MVYLWNATNNQLMFKHWTSFEAKGLLVFFSPLPMATLADFLPI